MRVAEQLKDRQVNDDRPFWESEQWNEEMAPLLELPEGEPPYVQAYAISGLEHARQQVFEELNGFAYSFVTQFGRLAVEWKEPMQIGMGQARFFEWPLLRNPWFKAGSELVLAEMALDRASSGFDRLHELKVVGSPTSLGENARRYLREVSHLFLLGFDGPCIAFCGAALEQVLKDALLRGQRATTREIEGLSASDLLSRSQADGLLKESVDYARRLIGERNRAMHRHLWDGKVIRQMAAVSVSDLTHVLTELATKVPE